MCIQPYAVDRSVGVQLAAGPTDELGARAQRTSSNLPPDSASPTMLFPPTMCTASASTDSK